MAQESQAAEAMVNAFRAAIRLYRFGIWLVSFGLPNLEL